MKNKLFRLIHTLVYCQVDPDHVISNEGSCFRKLSKTINVFKMIRPLPVCPAYPSLPYCSALALIFAPRFTRKKKTLKNAKLSKGGEQLRMLDLPDYSLNYLTLLSLNFYSALIFASNCSCNEIKWLQTYSMFCIATEVFSNIKQCFSAHNWVFMAGLWLVYGRFGWIVDGLAILCLGCGWFVGSFEFYS